MKKEIFIEPSFIEILFKDAIEKSCGFEEVDPKTMADRARHVQEWVTNQEIDPNELIKIFGEKLAPLEALLKGSLIQSQNAIFTRLFIEMVSELRVHGPRESLGGADPLGFLVNYEQNALSEKNSRRAPDSIPVITVPELNRVIQALVLHPNASDKEALAAMEKAGNESRFGAAIRDALRQKASGSPVHTNTQPSPPPGGDRQPK